MRCDVGSHRIIPHLGPRPKHHSIVPVIETNQFGLQRLGAKGLAGIRVKV